MYPGLGLILVTSPCAAAGTRHTAQVCEPNLSSDLYSLARLRAAFFPRASLGPGTGVLGPGLGAELGDGVRSSSVARIGTRRIWGFPERADPEERW